MATHRTHDVVFLIFLVGGLKARTKIGPIGNMCEPLRTLGGKQPRSRRNGYTCVNRCHKMKQLGVPLPPCPSGLRCVAKPGQRHPQRNIGNIRLLAAMKLSGHALSTHAQHKREVGTLWMASDAL